MSYSVNFFVDGHYAISASDAALSEYGECVLLSGCRPEGGVVGYWLVTVFNPGPGVYWQALPATPSLILSDCLLQS